MATVKEIYQFIDSIAPFRIQESFDNAGFLVGRGEAAVTSILVALDITEDIISEAAALGAQLIVAHHPVIFQPVKRITDEDVTGRKLLMLAERGIAAICAHTNLDAAFDGVNDQLARALGLEQIGPLHQEGVDEQDRPYGIGRTGIWNKGGTAPDFAAHVKAALGAASVRYVDAGKPVCRVAVGGGSCGSMLSDAAAAGCDTFVTADVKYDVFLEAKALGINLMDAGHYPTEDVVCQPLADRIQNRFPGLIVVKSRVHKEVFSCL